LARKTSLKQEEILLRRSKVIELRARGISERKMSEELGIPRSTLHSDLRVLKRQAALNIHHFVEQDLPHEAELLLENANALLRVAWGSLDEDVKEGKPPYAAIHSIIEILNMKSELMENKIELASYVKDKKEETEMDIQERVMREAYEAERARSEAVF
jgi:hypothetical protein